MAKGLADGGSGGGSAGTGAAAIARQIEAVRSDIRGLQARLASQLGGGNQHLLSLPDARKPWSVIYVGEDLTMEQGSLNAVLYAKSAGAHTITLPPATEGAWVSLYNFGDSDISMLDPDGSEICKIPAAQFAHIYAVYETTDADYVVWPDAVPVFRTSGTQNELLNIVIDDGEELELLWEIYQQLRQANETLMEIAS